VLVCYENVDQVKYISAVIVCVSHRELAIEIQALHLFSKENVDTVYWFPDPPLSMQFVQHKFIVLHRQTPCRLT
jgi:hypothetical protein